MSDATTVGKRLVEMCKAGQAHQAIDELYAPDIVSVEGPGGDPKMLRIQGIDGVRGKSEWWFANHEVHSMEANGPFCGQREDQFLVKFDIDVTHKESGQRIEMSEVGVYTVKDGKVVKEEFNYLVD